MATLPRTRKTASEVQSIGKDPFDPRIAPRAQIHRGSDTPSAIRKPIESPSHT